LCFGFVIIPLE